MHVNLVGKKIYKQKTKIVCTPQLNKYFFIFLVQKQILILCNSNPPITLVIPKISSQSLKCPRGN